VAASAVVVVVVLVTAALLSTGEPRTGPTTSSPTPSATTVDSSVVPVPTDVVAALSGERTVLFSWVNPDPQEGDRYLWGVDDGSDERQVTVSGSASVALPEGEDSVCIEVSVVRTDGRVSTRPARACYP